MKIYLMYLLLLVLPSSIYSSIGDGGSKPSIGFGGGYDGCKTFKGEIYTKLHIGDLFKRKSEARIGLTNRSYDFDFEGVKNQKASSINLFGDIVSYPFNKNIFVGIRWEVVSLNWFTNDVKNRIEAQSGYKLTPVYIGANYFIQSGYRLNLSSRSSLLLYGNVGIQRYTLTDGIHSLWGYVIDGDKKENKNKFSYNITLSFELGL